MRRVFLLGAVIAALVAIYWLAMGYGVHRVTETRYSAKASLPQTAPLSLLRAGQKAAFLELGSVGCKPCEAMKPVMEAVRRQHADQVDVIFHDVQRDPAMAGRYRVRLIPTQVFLLPDGTEFFRHEGYLSEREVLAVLHRMGVR